MDKKHELVGNEVSVIMLDGSEKKCFVAFCDDTKGMSIKDIETQESVLCHDIKMWNARRKFAKETGVALIYKHNGAYVHKYLKKCIKSGIMDGAKVNADLRYPDARGGVILTTCPSGL